MFVLADLEVHILRDRKRGVARVEEIGRNICKEDTKGYKILCNTHSNIFSFSVKTQVKKTARTYCPTQ
ncbi:hypothetical protein Y032_0172g373 [Ancylostoma ceylanicum]|uniref:Uncharacterized protein n=1 Tax=Ancylostoma ceylanicum TaxID=53326 RepID=A0A016SVN3_9BILA|nr:hypothetical protein Y032_0172g373 [Ancylostoma ceylanicum]